MGVSTNPEPKHTVSYVGAEREISHPDANGPLTTDLLEVEGRVLGIELQNLVVAASERLDLGRKAFERLPKLR
jgi:hypothetical protein